MALAKITSVSGRAVNVPGNDIDTDRIIPARFMKCVTFDGLGEFLFYDWRYAADGTPTEGFVLNDQRFANASILVTGENFGCGSSREHAPWSLLDHGFRVIIAPSFADIFYNNSFKNGLLPITLDAADVAWLADAAARDSNKEITVDLESCSVTDGLAFTRAFVIDEFRRHCLLNGLDDIGLTLQHESSITAFENRMAVSGR